jgi:8-oxo-dGTP diphosphatase
MHVISTVGILLFKENTVLLVKHGEGASHVTGSYGIPAGRIETGETDAHAAIRELQEETGLKTTEAYLEKLLLNIPDADIPRSDGTIKRFSITVFLCRHYFGELRVTDETTPEWVKMLEIEKLPLIGHTKMMIEDGRKFL